ncbi:Uncharacterised protein [Salmonella enterica subsp. enterica]|uniref:Uncharacterized protein n=1 Tax=Salmonella enterica I TaxID=59201 RepID=A0A447MXR5_SALET|nr:Uncharacterised protein [Salmonella enterica subsp. enterica]
MNVVFLHRSQLVKRARQAVPKKKLETEGCRCNDLTFCAPETAVGLEAAGDVFAIKQIIDMKGNVGACHAYARKVITYQCIDNRITPYFKGVCRIAIA